MKLLGNYLEVF